MNPNSCTKFCCVTNFQSIFIRLPQKQGDNRKSLKNQFAITFEHLLVLTSYFALSISVWDPNSYTRCGCVTSSQSLFVRLPQKQGNNWKSLTLYMVTTVLESPGMSWNLSFVLECPGKSWDFLVLGEMSWKCPGF